MKTFRIVTIDDNGSRTQDIPGRDMAQAIKDALYNLVSRDPYSLRSVTCTTL